MNAGYYSAGEFHLKLLELYEDIQGLEIHEGAYAPLGVGTVKMFFKIFLKQKLGR